MKRIAREFSLVFWLLVAFGVIAQAQNPAPPRIVFPTTTENHKLNSKLMAREMPYRIILPYDYKKSPGNYPVVYLLHGLTGNFNNWTDKTRLAEYASFCGCIIVTPEGENGWYTDSASAPNDRFESYIVQELIPEIDKKFRTRADRANRAIAGLSMGGYGALKFGLKYPATFALVGSFSGALGAASWSNKMLGGRGAIPESIMKVFGADGSTTRLENDIFTMAREMTPEKTRSLPFIYLDCGTEDFLIQNNRDFAALLVEKKIPHEFRQLPGAHTWEFWNSQVQEFLRLADRVFRARAAKAA